MLITRKEVIDKVEKFLAKSLSAEEIGWWAFDIIVESDLEYEPGHHRILRDVLEALQHFHDTDPIMSQFYPESEELIYYLKCLKGEELYNPKRVPHWRV